MSPLLIFIAYIAIHLHVSLAKTIKTPQEDHEKHNLFELLTSIDRRLAKLDENLRTSGVEEVAARKLEKLETTLRQYENLEESYVKNSNEIVTRIDTICERTQHRLMHLEMKIESAEKKLSEKMDILMARFEKMEDTLTTRESDIEEQIGEVLSVVEEIKIPTDLSAMDVISHNLLINHNVLISLLQMTVKKNTETLVKVNDKLEEIKASLQTREEIGDEVLADVKQMASVLNTTRNEQRNSFRSVVVQVGRIGGKNSICNPNLEIDQLKNLNETIHSRFENVITLQNLFLESCHRIQLDEEQIEEKISEVLEKLIEALQQQDLEKDLKNIEQLLKVHDANTRRNMFSNMHNIGVLFQKDKKSKDEHKTQLDKIENSIILIKEKLEETARPGNTHTSENNNVNVSDLFISTRRGLEHVDNIVDTITAVEKTETLMDTTKQVV